MPTNSLEIIDKGVVRLEMMHALKLQDIQIRMLPAEIIYKYYLDGTKMDIRELRL